MLRFQHSKPFPKPCVSKVSMQRKIHIPHKQVASLLVSSVVQQKAESHFRKIHHTIYLLIPTDLAHELMLQHNQPVKLEIGTNPHKTILVKIIEE